jgi:hypothetical protein
MTRLRAIGRALSRIDNIMSVVTIVTAVTLVLFGVFGGSIAPQATAEIIIALLGLVALTSMLERESRLAQTEIKLDRVQAALDGVRQLLRDSQGTSLFANDKLPHPDTVLESASEVFVAGAHSFNLLTRDPERWKAWLRKGKSVKVIVQNPWNKGLRYLAIPAHAYNYEIYKRNTMDVIEQLQVLSTAGPGIEIRLSDTCPTQGVIIVDGQNGGACMIVALYVPGCGSATRPTMMLTRERDQALFALFHEKYYVHLWNESQPLAKFGRAQAEDLA